MSPPSPSILCTPCQPYFTCHTKPMACLITYQLNPLQRTTVCQADQHKVAESALASCAAPPKFDKGISAHPGSRPDILSEKTVPGLQAMQPPAGSPGKGMRSEAAAPGSPTSLVNPLQSLLGYEYVLSPPKQLPRPGSPLGMSLHKNPYSCHRISNIKSPEMERSRCPKLSTELNLNAAVQWLLALCRALRKSASCLNFSARCRKWPAVS